MGSSPVGISVPLAIGLGLLASFVQSLGLTIQRKAHIQNESVPMTKRKSVWRKPLFLIGFLVFISANIGGTVFQVGTLPLTILAPLGAVSLLFNALLARVLLQGFLSFYMVSGTVLISVGAVLIGYFGAVQETQHSLDELLSLYSRPAFVAFATISFLVFAGVLVIAHLAEWQLQASLWRSLNPNLNSPNLKKKRKKSQTLRRRWSAPTLAPVVEVNESSSGIATPILDLVDEANRRGLPADKLIEAAKQREKESQSKESKKKGRSQASNQDQGSMSSKSTTLPKRRDYGTLSSSKSSKLSEFSSNRVTPPSSPKNHRGNRTPSSPISSPAGPTRRNSEPPALNIQDSTSHSLEESVIRRTQLGLAVAYGAASGTLSGVCLLLAKSGVELLVLTLSGHNQFDRLGSWGLVLIMLVAALLQLWYLNKSLKLADPTLVCPLAFCFYNTSSIALGLVYFNQLDSLAWYSVLLVVLGTTILLAGVWIVSLHGSNASADDDSCEEEDPSMSNIQSPISAASPFQGTGGIESSDAAETAALLANAAGVGGPHLPPQPLTCEPEQLESGATSPTTPLSPRKKRNRSHSRTGSIRLFSGSGIESDSSPFHKDEDDDGGLETLNDPHQPQYATANSAPRESKLKLYTSLLERGLSIGISPSSPGFLLSGGPDNPSSPNNTPRHSAIRKLSRRERQTFSESDVEALENPSIENVLGLSRNEEDQLEAGNLTRSSSSRTMIQREDPHFQDPDSEQSSQVVNQDRLETGYSRFNRIPGIDVGALTERLGRLSGVISNGERSEGGGLLSWIPSFRLRRNRDRQNMVGDGSIEERRSLLNTEEGNARPREPPWAGTRRR